MRRCVGFVAIGVFLSATVAPVANSGPSPRPGDAQTVRDWLRSELKNSDEFPPSYALAWSDLNGDGRPEAIVYVSGPGWCGSGGCGAYVLSLGSAGVTKLADTDVTRTPIAVLETQTHGFHDIAVAVCGGGIIRCYDARLRFDGHAYASNPTVAPAVPKRAPRQVVIGDHATNQPLYNDN